MNEIFFQDFGFGFADLKEALKMCDLTTKVYPLWLCPTRHKAHQGLEKYSMFHTEKLYFDVGLYG